MLKAKVIERIAEILYNYDVEGLKSLGAPTDEFSSEAVLIVAACIKSKNNVLWDREGQFDSELQDIIKTIFAEMMHYTDEKYFARWLEPATRDIRRMLLDEHEAYLKTIGRWKGADA